MANPAIFMLSQALAYTVVSNGSFLAPYFWRPFAPCFGSTLLVRPVYLLERSIVANNVSIFATKVPCLHPAVTFAESHRFFCVNVREYIGLDCCAGLRCNVCGRGAIAKILDNGNSQGAVLESFLPQAVEKAVLPISVPEDIVKEFREAELDVAHGAYRSGSALLRSVLEKTLKKNGYDEVEYEDKGVKKKSRSLLHRIDAASEDGVITETRKKRAHENIRVLGNDILHDDWREVKQEEFDEAQKYSQRVLEDFYDDRPTVEARLRSSGRIP